MYTPLVYTFLIGNCICSCIKHDSEFISTWVRKGLIFT